MYWGPLVWWVATKEDFTGLSRTGEGDGLVKPWVGSRASTHLLPLYWNPGTSNYFRELKKGGSFYLFVRAVVF